MGIAVKAIFVTAFKLQLAVTTVQCQGNECWRRGWCWGRTDKPGRLLEKL